MTSWSIKGKAIIYMVSSLRPTNKSNFFLSHLKQKLQPNTKNESKRIFFLTNNFPIAKLEMENVEKTNSLYNIKDLMKQKSRFIFEILIIFYICLLLFFFDLIKKKINKTTTTKYKLQPLNVFFHS